MIRATILLATALLFFSACSASQDSEVVTFTPMEYHIYTYTINNLAADGTRQYVAPEILPDMLQVYKEDQLEIKNSAIQAASMAPVIKIVDNPLQACYTNPDRYNWRKYASVYDWPLDELAKVIDVESKGDLCAINPSSSAICWLQDISGDPSLLDPVACMKRGYSKWLAGGRSFEPAWYRWWPK